MQGVSAQARVSMRQLVERILRSGSLTFESSARRMREGAMAHRAAQEAGRAEHAGKRTYRAEAFLRCLHEAHGVLLDVTGRIDALITGEAFPIIEEYKTLDGPIQQDIEGHPAHWAQAEGYAHMLCELEKHSHVEVRLCYLRVDGSVSVRLSRTHDAAELARRFTALADAYALLIRQRLDWEQRRNEVLNAATFPFGAFRPGQRAMAATVYRAMRDGGRAFIEAPTGTGKTAAALFPALKALGEGHVSQLFYLTARTTGRLAARETLAVMKKQGAGLHSLELTAKDRICRTRAEGGDCVPLECPYAIGYFDRINFALDAAWKDFHLTDDGIRALSDEFSLCPVELEFELTESADVVICDANYAFDPRARLQRVFEMTPSGVGLLIDEAHQLVSRARDMFSAELDERVAVLARKELNKALGRKHDASKAVSKLCKFIKEYRLAWKQTPNASVEEALRTLPEGLIEVAEEALLAVREVYPLPPNAMELMFTLWWFITLGAEMDETFRLLQRVAGSVTLRIWCLDPRRQIRAVCDSVKGTAFFSATLQPASYTRELLGGDPGDPFVCLPSPFPPKNLRLAVHTGFSTRYNDREATAPEVAALIARACTGSGNCLAFFPSYRYMTDVAEHLAAIAPQLEQLRQTQGMSQQQRDDFLARFTAEPSGDLLGLAVLGGAFSEGVDLPGARLSGVAVVGVGLPQICLENQTLRSHFDEQGLTGYDYAYVFPGFTRVVQAAGRLIRTDTDTGFLLLIDDRYARPPYPDLFPAHWQTASTLFYKS